MVKRPKGVGPEVCGVIRVECLGWASPLGIYYQADRAFVTEIALRGPLYQIPDWQYLRRDHAERAKRAYPTVRTWCVNLDPRRADRLRHPAVRLYAEYVSGSVAAIWRAQLPPADPQAYYRYLAPWMASRALPGRARRAEEPTSTALPDISADAVVAGRERRPS
jgi:hypothetical protein